MKTIARIQKLTADAEDAFEVDSQPVKDKEFKQKALAVASQVSINGHVIEKNDGCTLICDSKRYVLEIPLNERDDAERQIPVGFCGERKDVDENIVKNEVLSFIKRSGRTISDENIQNLSLCIKALKKRNKSRSFLYAFITLFCFLTLSSALLLCAKK